VSGAAPAGGVPPPVATDADASFVDDVDGEPSGRGRTSIENRVVEKTAAQSALEIDHVHGVSHRVTRVFTAGQTVQTHAWIDGHLARLQVNIEVDYPAPVKQVTRQVRQHIRERVNQLCGLTIVDLDIRVVALHVRSGPIRRVI